MPFIDESEVEQESGGQFMSEADVLPSGFLDESSISSEALTPEVLPATTGSGWGDTFDAIGGLGKGYLSEIGGAFGGLGDLIASPIASGINSIRDGQLEWTPSTFGREAFGGMVDDLAGNLGTQSAAGRAGTRGGQLAGTAAEFFTGGGALKNAPGLIGKAGALLSTAPRTQLVLSALGGMTGQGAAEAGMVERGGLGQMGVEIGTQMVPSVGQGLWSLGKAGLSPLRKLFFQNAPEAADEAVRAIENIGGANLLDDYGQASSKLGRSMRLAENIGGQEGVKRVTGEAVEGANKAVMESSSEVAQLMDEAREIKQIGRMSGWNPAMKQRIREIDQTLATVPKIDETIDVGFPLVYEKFGDLIKGTKATITETPNVAYEALKNLKSTNKIASSIYSDLTSVTGIGKKGGKSFSAKDYEKATERIGTKLLAGDGVVAKDFNKVMASSPESLAIGKTAALGEVFKGDPKDWLKQLNAKRSPLTTLLGEEAAPQAMKVLDDLANKHVDTVAGHMASYIHGFLGKKLIMGGLALASVKTGGLAIPATGVLYLADKAAKAVASKPTEMAALISKALTSPEARVLLSAKANPQNIKAATEFFTNAGKNLIMGTGKEYVNPPDKSATANLPKEEKKSEEIPEAISFKPDTIIPDVRQSSLPAKLIKNVIAQESSFNHRAVGPMTRKYGTAKGLMQLVDSTGEEWHQRLVKDGALPANSVYDPFDAEQNQAIGTAYLEHLADRYDGDVRLALAAYNWGMGNLDNLIKRVGSSDYDRLKSKLPDETFLYVKNISKKSNITEV